MADGTFPADAMREEPAGDGTTTVQGVIGGQATVAPGGGFSKADRTRLYLRGLLQKYRSTNTMPHSGKVVLLDVELSVKHAFWAIYDHGLNCAIAWDSTNRKFLGMLTYTDFMEVLRFLYRTTKESGTTDAAAVAVAIAAGLEAHQIKSWRDIRGGSSSPLGLSYVSPQQSLLDCVAILQKQHIHRVPVIDPDNNAVLCTVTYWRILRYLVQKIRKRRDVEVMNCTITEMGLGHRSLVTVCEDAPLVHVLDLLSENQISAVPVLTREGKLVNMYARSDVQYLALKQDFNLDMTVAEALKDKGGLVYRCRPAIDTLAMIVDVMVVQGVRRIVCVDDADNVSGIVSLSDIFRFIVGSADLAQSSELAGDQSFDEPSSER